jgi:chromate transporter
LFLFFLHAGVIYKKPLVNRKEFVDAVAVAMITPGPVVITVGFIGYLVAGFPECSSSGSGHLFLVIYLPLYRLLTLKKKMAKINLLNICRWHYCYSVGPW